jgi:membrane fusion protein (multidrug efflux system)
MKPYRLLIAGLIAALIVPAGTPVYATHSAQGTITASAIIVPAQITEPGFLTSALVKELAVNEGDRVQAGDLLVVLDMPDLQYAVTAAEAALRSAQANAILQSYGRVKERRNGKVFWTQLPKEYLEIANFQVLQAEAALEMAQANLAEATLFAPADATVTSIHIAPGEFVQPHQVVVTLATLDQLLVETTDLIERDIAGIQIGDTAEVFIEALNETVPGKVIAIAPRADVIGGDVVFKVTIELDHQPDGLLWGMTAEVNIAE